MNIYLKRFIRVSHRLAVVQQEGRESSNSSVRETGCLSSPDLVGGGIPGDSWRAAGLQSTLDPEEVDPNISGGRTASAAGW